MGMYSEAFSLIENQRREIELAKWEKISFEELEEMSLSDLEEFIKPPVIPRRISPPPIR